VAALDEIGAALDGERLLDADRRAALRALVDNMRSRDLYDLQESYGLLFDRTRSLSLHLFEHVHGESRDRGQAMVDLLALYEAKGLTAPSAELPDFTPLFLEFLSTLEPAEALALLDEPVHVFRALVEMAQAQPDAALLAVLRQEPDPQPDDLEALDAAYEEDAVDFGAPADDACGKDTLAAKLRQARRPAPDMAPPTFRTEFTHSPSSHS
jgi:nitrate reductase delta subunit